MTSVRVGSATDVGNVRTNNQDQLLVAHPLFAVADGMGGHAAGEVASLSAIEALKVAFAKDATVDGLVAAAEFANRAVWDRAQTDSELLGMGTTLVAAALVTLGEEEQLAVVNIGDSRAYLLRQGELEQLTTDHSLVQELVDDGQLSEAEAEVHPQRHVLTRALGVDPDVRVDRLEVVPVKGDRYLLCSDGLPREVPDNQIASVLRRLADPQEAAVELVSQARAHGGNDNITAIVIDVIDDDDKAAAASEALATEPGLSIPSQLIKGDAEEQSGPGGRWRRLRQPAHVVAPQSRALKQSRALTARVIGFIAMVAVLMAVAATAVGWYARGSYFVGVNQGELTIYKGRPGGLLWFKPTVVERTGVHATQVLASRLSDLRAGKEEGSLGGALQYVQNLQAEARAHGIGAPPTVTTTALPGSSTTSAASPAGTASVPASTAPAGTSSGTRAP